MRPDLKQHQIVVGYGEQMEIAFCTMLELSLLLEDLQFEA